MLRKMTIKQRFITTLVLVIAITTTAILYFVQRTTSQHVATEIGRYLAEVSFQFAERLDRDMWARSKELDLLKKYNDFAEQVNIEKIQASIDQLSADIPVFSWVGLTDAQGIVLASTGKILLHGDLSKRPVFAEAINKPFIGDVHDAVLLAKLLPNPTGEPMKFVDLSSPLHDRHGKFIGVLAAHLSWNWVREIEEAYFKPLFAKEHIELFIVSVDGTVLLGPAGFPGHHLDLKILEDVRHTNPIFKTKQWPDGKTYLTGASYGAGYKEYPGLGWTVVARQPVDVAHKDIDKLKNTILMIGLLFSACAVLGGVFISLQLTKPLNTIVQSSTELLNGTIANIPPYAGIPEIETLTTTLRNLIDSLRKTTKEKERMETMVFVDSLTALPNRAAFQEKTMAISRRQPRRNEALGILFLDLDGFKAVNDTFGHDTGDFVLQGAALRIRGCLRQEDFVARLGGDEFIAIIATTTAEATTDLATTAARIIKSVNLPMRVGDNIAHIGCSLGGAVWPADAADINTVVTYADSALYHSKSAGKNILTMHQAGQEAP